MDISPYDFMDNPPTSNRGVGNTSQCGLIALVDWLSVTFKKLSIDQELLDYLSLDLRDFIQLDNGLYGYKSAKMYNGIFILTHGSSVDMGCHLQITGTGCRYLETIDKFKWSDFFNLIDTIGDYNLTRLDLAIDDYKGYFTVKYIYDKLKKGHILSRFRTARHMEDINIADGKTKGRTIYFGSSASTIQIRIYDKFEERLSKGIYHDVEHWVRTELQLRKDRADIAFKHIKNANNPELRIIILSILNRYLRVLTPNKKDSNKSRWKNTRKWEKYLGKVKEIKLTKSPEQKTIDDSYNWIYNYVADSLLMLYKIGIDPYEFVKAGKLKDKHYKMINDFKQKKREMKNISQTIKV